MTEMNRIKDRNDELELKAKEAALQLSEEQRLSMQKLKKLTETEKKVEALRKSLHEAEAQHQTSLSDTMAENQKKEKLALEEKKTTIEENTIELNQLRAFLKEQTDRATDAQSSKDDMEKQLMTTVEEVSHFRVTLQETEKMKVHGSRDHAC